MRERQDEPFVERVPDWEREVPGQTVAIAVRCREVIEGVVHPTHVPLVIEPEGITARTSKGRLGGDNRGRSDCVNWAVRPWCPCPGPSRYRVATSNPFVRGGLFGKHQGPRNLAVDQTVQSAQEVDRFGVVGSSPRVWFPVIVWTPVIKPDH